jgi:hypothetical protein
MRLVMTSMSPSARYAFIIPVTARIARNSVYRVSLPALAVIDAIVETRRVNSRGKEPPRRAALAETRAEKVLHERAQRRQSAKRRGLVVVVVLRGRLGAKPRNGLHGGYLRVQQLESQFFDRRVVVRWGRRLLARRAHRHPARVFVFTYMLRVINADSKKKKNPGRPHMLTAMTVQLTSYITVVSMVGNERGGYAGTP